MGLAFLAPLFLLGLAALAVPVWVHLIQRQRSRVVEFPSLMFLERIPYRSVRRQRIRHWFLLLLRCAALALLVAAFARPFRAGDAAGAAGPGAREVVILLDRSYSMAYGDRWQRAQAAAREVVDGLGPEDRVSLVPFASRAEVAVRSTLDRTRVADEIARVRPGSSATRYAPALEAASALLDESPLPRREVVLVSDYQRTGWSGDEEIRLPPGARVLPVEIGEAEWSNVAVAGVTFRRALFSGQERVTVSARIVRRGGATPLELPVTLTVGGRDLESPTVTLPPDGAATVEFSPFTLTAPGTRGTVRVPEDALAPDDAHHFVLSPGAAIRVLVVDGPSTRGDASLYLRSALAVGQEPAVRLTVHRAPGLPAAPLEEHSVVVLNGAPFPEGTGARRLREFVEAGGGLWLVPGERGSWPEGIGDVLPGSLAPPASAAERRGAALGYVDYSHPVFDVFAAPRSGDLAAPRFHRYRPLSVDAGEVLARFDDGTPALVERRVGEGRVLVWTSTLDTFWNDLPVQPVFVPLVHRLVRHLAGWTEPVPWRTVGQVLELGGDGTMPAAGSPAAGAVGAGEASERVVLSPSGRQTSVGAGGRTPVPLDEAGIWEVRTPGETATPPIPLAVNVDLRESDLSPLDPEEIRTAVTRPGGGGLADHPGAPPTPEEQERRQALWWYLLAGALLLLLAETVLSNRLSTAPAA